MKQSPFRAPARAGFTLVEALIAMVVATIALSGLLSSLVSTQSLGDSNRESAVAYQGTRAVIESLLVEDAREVLVRYDEDGQNDPDGVDTAPGASFEVPGLAPQDGNEFVGSVLLPLTEDGRVVESTVDERFGLPRDLNADGVIDDDDRRADLVLLPVLVRLEWSGQVGDRFVEFGSLLRLQN